MPKLAPQFVEQVEETEATHGGSFEPIKPGKYLAQLAKVEARDTNNGDPAWNAEFENIHSLDTQERQPGRQWLNMNLPTTDKAPSSYTKGQDKWEQFQSLCKGRLAAFFEAFGYTPDSDTEEMEGEWCVITIGIRTIQNGARKGEKTNQVTDIEPVPDDIDVPETGGNTAAQDDDAF